jgi:hypothetical protein
MITSYIKLNSLKLIKLLVLCVRSIDAEWQKPKKKNVYWPRLSERIKQVILIILTNLTDFI